MSITAAKLNAVMRTLAEVGWSGLCADERAVCEAFDRGNLVILDSTPALPADKPATLSAGFWDACAVEPG